MGHGKKIVVILEACYIVTLIIDNRIYFSVIKLRRVVQNKKFVTEQSKNSNKVKGLKTGGSVMLSFYQSLRLLQLGLERLRPPRRRGGRTRPLSIVLTTIESTS